MSTASGPRLTSGIAASLLLHAGLIAALFSLRPSAEPAQPPMYRVQLIAAPAGDPAAGVVQDTPPVPTPVVKTPAPVTPPPAAKPAVVKKAISAAKKPAPTAKPVVKAATPSARAATPQPKKADTKTPPAPAPTAGGGPTGGKGTDVANVDTPGIDFPYPAYTTNIVSQLIRRFGAMQGTLSATVRFVIRRDGSIDPESIKMVTPSGSYPFDQRAYGAVESAANAKAFGPLPPGFREDILPVTFRFSPSLNQ